MPSRTFRIPPLCCWILICTNSKLGMLTRPAPQCFVRHSIGMSIGDATEAWRVGRDRKSRGGMKALAVAALCLIGCAGAGKAADLSDALPKKAPRAAAASPYDWSGFYLGGHLGYAWGSSHWTGAGTSGTLDLSQGFNSFDETGSFFA